MGWDRYSLAVGTIDSNALVQKGFLRRSDQKNDAEEVFDAVK